MTVVCAGNGVVKATVPWKDVDVRDGVYVAGDGAVPGVPVVFLFVPGARGVDTFFGVLGFLELGMADVL